MWWLFFISPTLWLSKQIIDAIVKEPTKVGSNAASTVVAPQFGEKGDLSGSKVVVIGRTGAGKSSFINMLSGRDTLAVGPVASTTRWIEGVRVRLAEREVVFVDTPGYGEAYTANDYCARLLNWVTKNRDSVEMILLVLQADTKAYVDDYRMLQQVRSALSQIPVMIILNQVDKTLPCRQPFKTTAWPSEQSRDTVKSRHISEKIEEVCRQFDLDPRHVEPSVSFGHAFNRCQLLSMIGQRLGETCP